MQTYAAFLFAKPYSELVEAAAQKFSIPKELIYAIMRQESAFNPFARSPADAFGLMQLTLGTAKNIAKAASRHVSSAKDLYDPATSIDLGAALLAQLFASKNQLVFVAASYNASQTALDKWLQMYPATDILEFIEDIPYEETLGYVKLIIRNIVFYQRLEATQDIFFCQWCLDSLQSPRN